MIMWKRMMLRIGVMNWRMRIDELVDWIDDWVGVDDEGGDYGGDLDDGGEDRCVVGVDEQGDEHNGKE